MSLTDRIAAFLHPHPGGVRGVGERLASLEARLTELESHQLAHDVAWTEAKDQIGRHLKRVAAIENRQGHREERSELSRRVLELKLGKGAV